MRLVVKVADIRFRDLGTQPEESRTTSSGCSTLKFPINEYEYVDSQHNSMRCI